MYGPTVGNATVRIGSSNAQDNHIRYDYPAGASAYWLVGCDASEPGEFIIWDSKTGDPPHILCETETGFVGISTLSPGYPLHVDGQEYITQQLGVEATPDADYSIKTGNDVYVGDELYIVTTTQDDTLSSKVLTKDPSSNKVFETSLGGYLTGFSVNCQSGVSFPVNVANPSITFKGFTVGPLYTNGSTTSPGTVTGS